MVLRPSIGSEGYPPQSGQSVRRWTCTCVNSSETRSTVRNASSSGGWTLLQELDRLERLQRAEHARGRAEDAGLRARLRVLGLHRERAAVARGGDRGRIVITSPLHPTAPPSTRSTPASQHACVDGVARGEGVRAVDHEVLALDEPGGVRLVQAHLVGLDQHVRVQEAQLGRGRLHLGHAEVGREVQRLAVQVGDLDHVGVHEPDPPDARAREVQRHGRAEPPAPTTSTDASRSAICASSRPVREHELARVALDLGLCQQRRDDLLGRCFRLRPRPAAPRGPPAGARPGRKPRRDASLMRARSGSSCRRHPRRGRPRAPSGGRWSAPPRAGGAPPASRPPGAVRAPASSAPTSSGSGGR